MPLLRCVALAPAHDPRWANAALPWGTDGVVLDLDALVHPRRVDEARRAVAEHLRRPPAQGTLTPPLLVRLPASPPVEDWDAVNASRLGGIVLAGAEEALQVAHAGTRLEEIERAQGLPPGSLPLFLSLETGKGLWHLADLVQASPRVQGVILGLGDAVYDLADTPEPVPFYRLPIPRYSTPLFVYSRTAYLACALGIQRLVCLGTSIAPGWANASLLEQGARRASALGFTGAVTVHPEGVRACQAFFPPG
ncbi:Citrate lyase subunit beta [bacterium HR23]|nr:Citrate lyase subunit beta [bacterium HR23]